MGTLMSDKVSFMSSKYDLYSTLVIAMLYSVSCYSSPCYNISISMSELHVRRRIHFQTWLYAYCADGEVMFHDITKRKEN